MRCIVTAGPTYEPLDQVRRLTNHSTGRLGSVLAEYLANAGHEVILLRGVMAVHRTPLPKQCRVIEFATGADLAGTLQALASDTEAAIFHAAAVSDFAFGKIWRVDRSGGMEELVSGKLETANGDLIAELKPVAKILAELRSWFPNGLIVGWKYEVDGDRTSALEAGRRQLKANRTNACVVNGPAYGDGFGWMKEGGESRHLANVDDLCELLASLIATSVLPSRSQAD